MGPLVHATERLELREFSLADARGLFELNADAEVLRFTGDRPFATIDAARELVAGYSHYREHGFGRWALWLRDTSEFVGFCGLRRDDVSGEVDLGFRVARARWGRGYASEAAAAAVQIGFERYGLSEIIGRAMPDNHASHRVLGKLGFLERGRTHDATGEWIVYVLRRERLPDA